LFGRKAEDPDEIHPVQFGDHMTISHADAKYRTRITAVRVEGPHYCTSQSAYMYLYM